MRTQTLLHRNSTGYYEFAHKSLAEFFVALKLIGELGYLSPNYLSTYLEEDLKPCVFPYNEKEPVELIPTFGSNSFISASMRAVVDFMKLIASADIKNKLIELLDFTKGKTDEDVKYLGGNSTTLFRELQFSFNDLDLSNACLSGANLQKLDLTKIKLNNCYLGEANLVYSRFFENEILSAKLTNTSFSIFYKIDLKEKLQNRKIRKIISQDKAHPLTRFLTKVGSQNDFSFAQIIFDLIFEHLHSKYNSMLESGEFRSFEKSCEIYVIFKTNNVDGLTSSLTDYLQSQLNTVTNIEKITQAFYANEILDFKKDRSNSLVHY